MINEATEGTTSQGVNLDQFKKILAGESKK